MERFDSGSIRHYPQTNPLCKPFVTITYKVADSLSLRSDVCGLRVVYTSGERDGFGGDGAGLGT